MEKQRKPMARSGYHPCCSWRWDLQFPRNFLCWGFLGGKLQGKLLGETVEWVDPSNIFGGKVEPGNVSNPFKNMLKIILAGLPAIAPPLTLRHKTFPFDSTSQILASHLEQGLPPHITPLRRTRRTLVRAMKKPWGSVRSCIGFFRMSKLRQSMP